MDSVSILGPDGVSQLGLQLGHSYGAVKDRKENAPLKQLTRFRVRVVHRLKKTLEKATDDSNYYVSPKKDMLQRFHLPSIPETFWCSPGGAGATKSSHKKQVIKGKISTWIKTR